MRWLRGFVLIAVAAVALLMWRFRGDEEVSADRLSPAVTDSRSTGHAVPEAPAGAAKSPVAPLDPVASDTAVVRSAVTAAGPDSGCHVQVVAPGGVPAVGARVWAIACPAGCYASMMEKELEEILASSPVQATGPDGSCQVDLAPELAYLIHVQADDYAWAGVPADRSTSHVKVTLQKPENIRGIVVDGQAGPVPDAAVVRYGMYFTEDIERLPLPELIARAILQEKCFTNEDGSFAFRHAGRGPHVVNSQPDGFAKATAAPVEANEFVRLVVLRSGVLSGRVSDTRGQPIENAEVSYYAHGRWPPQQGELVHTKSDGGYVIDTCFAGPVRLLGTAPGYEMVEKRVEVPEGGRAVQDLELDAEASIAGVVVDSSGSPVAEVNVQALDEVLGLLRPAQVSDAQGRFRLGVLSHGAPTTIYLDKQGYQSDVVRKVAAGTAHARLTLLRESYLSVRLQGDSDLPSALTYRIGIGGRFLFAADRAHAEWETRTAQIKDGTARLGPLEYGANSFELRVAGYATVHLHDLSISEGMNGPLDVALDRGQEIAVEIVDQAGEAVAGARIEKLERFHDGRWIPSADPLFVTGDKDGRAHLVVAPSERLGLVVSAAGLAPAYALDVVASAVHDPIVIELGPGGVIEGSVGSDYPSPETIITVRAHPLGVVGAGARSLQARPDPQGRFRLEHVPVGWIDVEAEDIALEISHRDAQSPMRRVQVREGEVTHVDFAPMGFCRVNGKLLGLSEPVLVQASQWHESTDGAVLAADRTRADGSFLLLNLRPGRYLLRAQPGRPGYTASVEKPFDIPVGATLTELTIELPPGRVGGTVVARDGSPIAAAAGVLRPSGQMFTTDSVGQFVVEALAGPVDLLVRASGFGARELIQASLQEDLQVTLAPEAVVIITAEDHEGAPLAGVRCALSPQQGSLARSVTTNPRGASQFDQLEAGTYQVVASHPLYLDATLTLRLTAGEFRELPCRLVPAGSAEIDVVDYLNTPASGISVLLQPLAGGSPGHSVPTDENGHLIISKIAAGTYSVRTANSDPVTLDVRHGLTAKATVVLRQDQ